MTIQPAFLSAKGLKSAARLIGFTNSFGYAVHLLLLLCSHSPNDVPPEPQRNVSIAAVRGAVRPSKYAVHLFWSLLKSSSKRNKHA